MTIDKQEIKRMLLEVLPEVLETVEAVKSVQEKNKKPKKEKKFNYSEEQKQQAIQMSRPVKERFPKMDINIEKWADAVRKIQDLGYSEQCIYEVWLFIQTYENGSFNWWSNIRTPMKLLLKKDGLSYMEKILNQKNCTAPRAYPGQPNNHDHWT